MLWHEKEKRVRFQSLRVMITSTIIVFILLAYSNQAGNLVDFMDTAPNMSKGRKHTEIGDLLEQTFDNHSLGIHCENQPNHVFSLYPQKNHLAKSCSCKRFKRGEWGTPSKCLTDPSH